MACSYYTIAVQEYLTLYYVDVYTFFGIKDAVTSWYISN